MAVITTYCRQNGHIIIYYKKLFDGTKIIDIGISDNPTSLGSMYGTVSHIEQGEASVLL